MISLSNSIFVDCHVRIIISVYLSLVQLHVKEQVVEDKQQEILHLMHTIDRPIDVVLQTKLFV